jgi:hypothetical protein
MASPPKGLRGAMRRNISEGRNNMRSAINATLVKAFALSA